MRWFPLLLLIAFSCKSTKSLVEITNTTVAAFFVGPHQEVHGHDYYIYFTRTKGTDLKGQKLWVDGYSVETTNKWLTEEILEIHASVVEKGSREIEIPESPHETPPQTYKGKALLKYALNGHDFYIDIKTFTNTASVIVK